MANERPVTSINSSSSKSLDEQKKAFKSRIARVVTRGFIVDRLNVQLPDDVHGEWIRDEPVAVAEARALGFEIDDKYATKEALHTDSSGKPKIGDVVFMTMPKWQKEIIDEAKKDEYARHHGVRRGTKPAEESQYETAIPRETPVINESKTKNQELRTLVTD